MGHTDPRVSHRDLARPPGPPYILVQMEGSEEIVMTNDVTKFCVSWVTINVVSPAVESFVSSWNAHRIPGRDGGIPIVLAWTRNQATHLQRLSIPTVEDAISLHANAGGT